MLVLEVIRWSAWGLVLFLLGRALVWRWRHRDELLHLNWETWIEQRPRWVLALARICAFAPVVQYRLLAGFLFMRAYGRLARTEDALRAARKLFEILPRDVCPWRLLNTAVDVFVNAGSYREGVDAEERWSSTARDRGRELDPVLFATTQINRAEAFFNLGETEPALALLEQVYATVEPYPFTRNGHLCLHAWILIHEGRLERARELLVRLELGPLTPRYVAEVYFTWAAFERESGSFEHALEHAERGLAASVRPSSERNGLFMIASIEALRANEARAREYFERAVGHRYRGQGADGLFRYAEFLERTEGSNAAEPIYRLLIERDGESALATRARRQISKDAA